MKPQMEIRIWGSSPLVGKKRKEIEKNYNVSIIKVARGLKASNPEDDLIIEEADYITYIGESDFCLKLLRDSAPR